LVIAEGLLMYLTEPQIRDLLQRLTDRFGSGELLADLLSPWGPRFSNSPLLARAATSGITKWGNRDGHELPKWISRMRLVDTCMFLDPAKVPLKPQRLVYRLLTAVPFIANYDRLYRFRF
jgi:O-methyltransferase involved in polyketide biosynthesis